MVPPMIVPTMRSTPLETVISTLQSPTLPSGATHRLATSGLQQSQIGIIASNVMTNLVTCSHA